MKLNRNSIAPPRIEMLPLIDIVFLLLVFFIYAMLSMAVHHGQAVDLPQSSSAVLDSREAISITIKMADQGINIFVNEEQVTLALLNKRLRDEKATKGGSQECEVQIFADKSISYQELFQVLDQVKQAGLTHISLQSEPDKRV